MNLDEMEIIQEFTKISMVFQRGFFGSSSHLHTISLIFPTDAQVSPVVLRIVDTVSLVAP